MKVKWCVVVVVLVWASGPARRAWGLDWSVKTVDSQGWAGASASLALDGAGRPRVAYSHKDPHTLDDTLKYAAVGPGSILDLNGLKLYYDGQFVNQGEVLGGSPIAEPAALALLGLGALAVMRRKGRKACVSVSAERGGKR